MLTKKNLVDILENTIDDAVLSVLLADRSTNGNILWCTDDYEILGTGYSANNPIEISLISGEKDGIIKPRVEKDTASQQLRSRERGEVFTPSWVCNAQNNLVDDAWFGVHRKRFNSEKESGWTTNYYPISFREAGGRTWQDYVKATRLEVSCGEAPYLTSRYDTVTGKYIAVPSRIGLLDRKLRVISENVTSQQDWLAWAITAVQNTYGYDLQGDNVLLARENILFSVVEAYYHIFDSLPEKKVILTLADIISWNIWQMDGIKFVVPNTCHQEIEEQFGLFEIAHEVHECCGCKTGDPYKHNGVYCLIKDWDTGEKIRFVDLMKGAKV